jgi:molybdopterin-guanine dinucleotide biosynthesis protein A
MSRAVTAVVLVGGRSRRMGQDKALLVPDAADGRTLTQLVLDALAPVCSTALLAGRALPGLDVAAVADQYSGAGPLGGVVSALAEVRTELALVAACDMPSIAPPLPALLIERAVAHPDATAVMCSTDQGLEPLLSVWRVAAAEPVLRAAVESGVRSLRDAVALLPRVLVLPPQEWRAADAGGASFRNWNQPGDIAGSA